MQCNVKAERTGSIGDLQKRDDLQLLTDSQDVNAVKEYFGNREAVKEFDGFFVKVEEGDLPEVYGFHGIVPNLDKDIYKIERICKI